MAGTADTSQRPQGQCSSGLKTVECAEERDAKAQEAVRCLEPLQKGQGYPGLPLWARAPSP